MSYHGVDFGFAPAFAGAAALTALLPLAGARVVPPIVRVALALAIVPLTYPVQGEVHDGDVLIKASLAACAGSVTGLGTSIVAACAAAAGGLIDGAFSLGAIAPDRIFGQTAGPFGILVPLVFALVMTSSGALTWIIAEYALAYNALAASSLDVAVGRVAQHLSFLANEGPGATLFSITLAIALPALCAHALGTLVAGVVARFSPRVNGILLAPALGSTMALVVMTAGTPALFYAMVLLAHVVVRSALH